MSTSRTTRPTPATEHRFADMTTVPRRRDDPSIAFGRLVVAVVVAIVVTIAAFAGAVGAFFAGTQVPQDPVSVNVVGSWNANTNSPVAKAKKTVITHTLLKNLRK